MFSTNMGTSSLHGLNRFLITKMISFVYIYLQGKGKYLYSLNIQKAFVFIPCFFLMVSASRYKDTWMDRLLPIGKNTCIGTRTPSTSTFQLSWSSIKLESCIHSQQQSHCHKQQSLWLKDGYLKPYDSLLPTKSSFLKLTVCL